MTDGLDDVIELECGRSGRFLGQTLFPRPGGHGIFFVRFFFLVRCTFFF